MKKTLAIILPILLLTHLNANSYQSVFADGSYRLQSNLAKNDQGEWIDDCAYIEGNEIGEWTTYYDDDNFSNGISSGFLIEDELFIVTVLNNYYAYCSFNEIELDDIISVVLGISLDSSSEGMEVFLPDDAEISITFNSVVGIIL